MSEPVGVLVMAHGTPGHRDEVEAFYTRIRRGRPPTPEQLADLQRRYDAIGGLSPLTERTAAQVDALRAALDAQAPGQFVVAFGAKHTQPFIEDGVAELERQGVSEIIGLVLTPHGAAMGSREYLDRAEAALEGRTPFTAIPHWYAQPDFVQLMSERVVTARATLDGSGPVIFTAHSLPERVRAQGDDYPEQLEASARLVAKAAGLTEWRVAWQSAGRTPEPWLGPDVRDVVRELGQAPDVDHAVISPIGFVADHLEVLYDLDIELALVAADAHLPIARTASLNDDPRFIAVLADVVGQARSER